MKKHLKIAIILIALLLIGLILFFIFSNFKKENVIKTFGNIEIRTVDLSFQVSGTINNIFVEEGDYVKKGDLLATLDDRDYRANLKDAIFKEKSAIAQNREDYSKFERNYPLCSDGSISKQDCTTLLNKKDLSSAQAGSAKANLEYQKNQLFYTKLYAPQDGIIITRAQEKGARVAKNQTVFIMSLVSPMWVRAYIKETDLGNIKYGTLADILTDTIDSKTGKNKSYKGYIGFISPVAEFTPKTVQTEDLRVDLVYRIRIYIDEYDEYLRQGMPVTVKLKVES